MIRRQIEFRAENDERKNENIGKPVKILVAGGTISYVGCLERYDNGIAILRPSIIYEPIFDVIGKETPRYRVERERPLEITTIVAIVPLSEEFYNSLTILNREQTYS